MKLIAFYATLIILFFTSCNYVIGKRIRGNGNIKTESRSVGSFNSIDVSGNAKVYVMQDSISTVRVETDENLLPYLLIENKNGILEIHSKNRINLSPSRAIKVFVSGPSFKRFEASGACNYYSENKITSTEPIFIDLSGASDVQLELKAPKVEAELSGAGTISLKGETKDFIVDGSGATDVKCFGLMTENTKIEMSGAGNAEVFASVKLDVHVSGAADVRYKGNASVTQEISGAGKVKKVD